MTRLTVERLFGETPLTGTVPTRIKFAPDGRIFIAEKGGAVALSNERLAHGFARLER